MVCGSLTKLTYRMSSDPPAKVWPSRGVGMWGSGDVGLELNPELLPHVVHPPLRLLIHHDLPRPLAREPLLLPFPRRVDSHLRAEGETAARVVEHVDRSHGEPHVALGIDVVQRHPPRLDRKSVV